MSISHHRPPGARRILVAPDSFKGSLEAREAAEAIRDGWLSRRPHDEVILRPMADGGEGTVDAFATAYPEAVRNEVSVTGPDGKAVPTSWLRLPDGRAVVELAATSGITLLSELAPLSAHTRGLGQAIRAALAAGVSSLAVAVGGSASTDAGAGALRELGATLLDVDGQPVKDGGEGLAHCVSVGLDELVPLPTGGVQVLSDVTNPLCGPQGAAHVFGPQKGASPAEVEYLDAALRNFARIVASGRPQHFDPISTPGAGAAGGTAYGMLVWGAHLSPGSIAVGDAVGIPTLMPTVDLVITGEGRFDEQSAAGKVPSYISDVAARYRVQTTLIAGQVVGNTAAFAHSISLEKLAGSVSLAMATPAEWLVEAGREMATSASIH